MLRYRPGVALIVVDVQNDFADPAGGLSVAGGEDVIPVINGEIQLARTTARWCSAPRTGTRSTRRTSPRTAGSGPTTASRTRGARSSTRRSRSGDAPIVRKGTNGEDGYSGFTMRDSTTHETIPTPLDALLREQGVDEVVVTGLATDYCLKATALDAIASATGRRC